eukprot:Gb_28474 [translate_table: standard]
MKQGLHLEKRGLSDKKMVPATLRDATRQRLTTALQQALQRLGEGNLEIQIVATTLESQCYKKYGKSGRSFYNSQIASIVRWLATTSLTDIQSRIEPDTIVDDSKSRSSLISNKVNHPLLTNNSSTEPATSTTNEMPQLEQGLAAFKSSCPNHGTQCLAGNTEARKQLPSVPSFDDFARKRGKDIDKSRSSVPLNSSINDHKVHNTNKRPHIKQVEDKVYAEQKNSSSNSTIIHSRDNAVKKRKLITAPSSNDFQRNDNNKHDHVDLCK